MPLVTLNYCWHDLINCTFQNEKIKHFQTFITAIGTVSDPFSPRQVYRQCSFFFTIIQIKVYPQSFVLQDHHNSGSDSFTRRWKKREFNKSNKFIWMWHDTTFSINSLQLWQMLTSTFTQCSEVSSPSKIVGTNIIDYNQWNHNNKLYLFLQL